MGLPFFLFKPFIMNRLLLNLHVPDSIWGHVGNSFQEQLSISLMQRLLKQKKTKKTSRKLRTQYRMNELIMKWPSAVFYQNKLIAHHSVANNTLKDTSKCGNFLSLNPEIWNENITFLRYLFEITHLEFILINRAQWRCDFLLRNIVLGKMRSNNIHWLHLYSVINKMCNFRYSTFCIEDSQRNVKYL